MGITGLGVPPHQVGGQLERGMLLSLPAGDVLEHDVRVPEAALDVAPYEGGGDGQRRPVQTFTPLLRCRRRGPLHLADYRRAPLVLDGDLWDRLIRDVARVGGS